MFSCSTLLYIWCSIRKCSTGDSWGDNKPARVWCQGFSCSRWSRPWTSELSQTPRRLYSRQHCCARLTSLPSTKLWTLGFSHLLVASWPLSCGFQVFSSSTFILVTNFKFLGKETKHPFYPSHAHCLMKSIVWVVCFAIPVLYFTTGQDCSFYAWVLKTPKGGFELLLRTEEFPPGREHLFSELSAHHEIIL